MQKGIFQSHKTCQKFSETDFKFDLRVSFVRFCKLNISQSATEASQINIFVYMTY